MYKHILFVMMISVLLLGCSSQTLETPPVDDKTTYVEEINKVNPQEEVVLPIEDTTCEGGAKKLVPQYLAYPTDTFYNNSYLVPNYWADKTLLEFPGAYRMITKKQFSVVYRKGANEGENANYYYMVDLEPSDLGKYIAFKYARKALGPDGTILGTNSFHMRPILKDSGKNFSISFTPEDWKLIIKWSGFDEDMKKIINQKNLYFETYYKTFPEVICTFSTTEESGSYTCNVPSHFPKPNKEDYYMYIYPNPNNFRIMEIVEPNVVYCSWVK